MTESSHRSTLQQSSTLETAQHTKQQKPACPKNHQMLSSNLVSIRESSVSLALTFWFKKLFFSYFYEERLRT